jgi:MFS family permease
LTGATGQDPIVDRAMPTGSTIGDPEAATRADLRHNLLALGGDYGLFMIGMSFASQSTILPAFAAHLGASNVVLGAIPAVMTLGWFLPSVFAAGYTETLPRRLPFVLRWTMWERAPFLVLALAAFVGDRAPTLALAVLLAMLFVITGTGGLLMPAWMDIVGRVVPTQLRGRLFAFSNLAASAGGLAGSVLTTAILARLAAPVSYGVCFLIAALFMGLSWIMLLRVHEPPAAVTGETTTLGEYLRRLPALLRRDQNFSRYLVARTLLFVGAMSTGFYTVHALRVLGAPAWQVGTFTAMLFVGQIAGNLTLGWLADHAGHRLVIAVGAAATLAANLVVLGTPSLAVFTLVFAFHGVSIAAVHVSGQNLLLEFAPSPIEQPTYVGLGNSLMTPAAFGAPLAGGLLADALGFTALFSTAAIVGAFGLVLLLVRVREPRGARG